MKLDQKFRLADRYNKPDSIIVIASFPGRHDRSIKDIDAVASYTDHFVGALRRELAPENRSLIILAQKIGPSEEWYEEKGVLVARVWQKGSLLSFAQIFLTFLFFNNVSDVLAQFEFHQFGGNLTTALFPLFLAALRMLGKRTRLVLHQVVEDISVLSGHLNLPKRSLKTVFFNRALRAFYRTVTKLADTTIVHSAELAKRLQRITGTTGAVVIPHGLGALKARVSRKRARQLLGYKQSEVVIMAFGFLTWYKGVDWLLQTFKRHSHRRYRLLIAGGESPNLKDRPHYRAFTKRLYKSAKTDQRITVTGFVEDRDIAKYFAAADLVVLPYRTLMSASGPFAMTVAFERPFILSKALKSYLADSDVDSLCTQLNLSDRQLLFDLQAKDFLRAVRRALAHKRQHQKLSQQLRLRRLWPTVAQQVTALFPSPVVAGIRSFAIIQKGDSYTYARA